MKQALLGGVALWVGVVGIADAQSDDPVNLTEELVVIGEKQFKSIQDTATSVEIVTSEQIRKLNIVDLEDALRRIGNAGFTATGGGVEQFTLRGVQSGGFASGNTPVATLIVDGAFIPNQAAGSTISNAWDVTQIEILRGAQSTLQGRNSLIGAIVVNTQDPTDEFDVRGRLVYSEADTLETSFAFGGPIVEDQLSFRVAGQYLASDGFTKRPDGSDADNEESVLIRGKLRIEPKGIENLTWDLVATYSDEEDGGVLVSAANPGARVQQTDVATFTEREVFTFGSEITYDINDKWTLQSVTNYAKLETDEVDDFDGQPNLGLPISPQRTDVRENVDWLQEFRVLYDGERISALFGALYAGRKNDDLTNVQQTLPIPMADLADLSAFGLPGVGLDPVYQGVVAQATGGAITNFATPADAPRFLNDPLLLGPLLPLSTDFNFNPSFNTFAVFGEASYAFSDAFEVTFGFRYENEKAKYEAFQVNTLTETADQLALSPDGNPGLATAIQTSLTNNLTPFVGPQNAAAIAAGGTPSIVPFYGQIAQGAVIAATGGNQNALVPVSVDEDLSFNVFLPKFVATFNVNDDLSFSASAQRAYRPGGIGINPVRGQAFLFDPEFSWNYELAMRSSWLDGSLIFNANLFYIDWKDQQIEVILSGTPQDTETDNVGGSELYGLETTLLWQVDEHWNIFGSLGLVETEITEVDATNAAILGNEFPFAPNVTGALGVTYEHGNGLSATVDMNYQGSSEPVIPNNSGPNPFPGSTGLRNDSFVLFNARLAYEQENYSVFLYASNLFNETYLVNADALAGNVIVGEPRVFGGGVTFDF
ncbi:MAG: TonB-dependent receptor [Pseudomonadota bacterium]